MIYNIRTWIGIYDMKAPKSDLAKKILSDPQASMSLRKKLCRADSFKEFTDLIFEGTAYRIQIVSPITGKVVAESVSKKKFKG